MADIRMTANMELADLRLHEKTGKTLVQFLKAARKVDPKTGKPQTWDDIAFEIRSLIGMRIVRETAINWATRLGVAPEREHVEGEPEGGQLAA